MIAKPNNSYSTTDDVVRQLRNHFFTISSNLPGIHKIMRSLDEIRALLDCLAISTIEYDVAVARINNAKRYLQSDETGAASYEVRLLIGGLQAQIDSQADIHIESPSLPICGATSNWASAVV